MSDETSYPPDEHVVDLRRITAATLDYAENFDQVAPLAGKLVPTKET